MFKLGLLISFGTLLSRITGFMRDALIASIFGTSDTADTLNIALRLPNLFRRIFADGAMSAVFIPLYVTQKTQSPKKAALFAGNILILLTIILIIVIVALIICMKQLMFVIAPGFLSNPTKLELVVFLCRITITYLLLISLTALLGGILNAEGKFFAFAFMPCILNIVIMAFVLWCKIADIEIVISTAVVVGGMAQLVFMYTMIRNGTFDISQFKINADVRTFLRKMLPASVNAGMVQINTFASQSIASLVDGTVSILSYSDRIYQLPLSLIGTTLGTVLLPTLTKMRYTNDAKVNNLSKINALKFGLLLSLPSACGLISLSYYIVAIIYKRGEFNDLDALHTANALVIFAIGIPALILNKVYIAIFSAHLNQKTPMYITIYGIIINTILCICLIQWSYIGIAAASVITAWTNMLWLHWYATKHEYINISGTFLKFGIKVLGLSLLMGAGVYNIHAYFYTIFSGLFAIVLAISLGILMYGLGILALGLISFKQRHINFH